MTETFLLTREAIQLWDNAEKQSKYIRIAKNVRMAARSERLRETERSRINHKSMFYSASNWCCAVLNKITGVEYRGGVNERKWSRSSITDQVQEQVASGWPSNARGSRGEAMGRECRPLNTATATTTTPTNTLSAIHTNTHHYHHSCHPSYNSQLISVSATQK